MDTATKYDALASFESRFSKQRKTYPVHKQLRFKPNNNFDVVEDINDWLLVNYPMKDGTRMLDAGCGTGKTLFSFANKYNINGLGISLSNNEIALASEAAMEINVAHRCSFKVVSYDDPFDQTFDQIIAIESLKHSKNLALSLKNLALSLSPGGSLIIVEDVRTGALPKKLFRRLLLKHWSLVELYTKNDYVLPSINSGLILTREVDFTHLVKVRKSWWSYVLVYLILVLKFFIPFPAPQKILSIFQAGFSLEYYYRKGYMQYKVLVFKK